MDKYWGYHLALDVSKCDREAIADYNTIYSFTKALVRRIDMVAFGEPQIVHFGTDDKQGYTLIQLIETSNIAAHFVEENNSFYLDVFSCKEFNIETVKDTVREYFSPQGMRVHYFVRQA